MGEELQQQRAGPFAAVRARELTKRFGSRTALAGVDFEAGTGELVTLVGDNGAGKSTLLRLLGGFLVPDSGSASVLGHDTVRDRSAVAAVTGTMLEGQHSWYPRLSGLANLQFFAAAATAARPGAQAGALEGLRAVGLEAQAELPVAGYSSGMRARLALARSRIHDPPVLLLDEPTNHLDHAAAAGLIELLQAVLGLKTMIIATHDRRLIEELDGRVVCLEQGRVRAAAGSRSLLREPSP